MDENLILKLSSATNGGAITSTSCFQTTALHIYNEYRPIENEPIDFVRLKSNPPICHGCGYEIKDRFLLRVLDHHWHDSCLRCSICDKILSNQETCFMKNSSVYCKDDYAQLFSTKCAKCFVPLQPTDFVFRCRDRVFHTHCFHCSYCGAVLKKGDQYFFIEGQILCQHDYALVAACQQVPPMTDLPYHHIRPTYIDFDHHTDRHGKKTPKRPRTILNSHQRRAFKMAFDKGAKPSRKVREQLAKETGLSVRVVQVWFQNQRAKIKKIQRKQENGGRTSTGGPNGSTDSEKSADIDAKSPLASSTRSEPDSDLEDYEVDVEHGSGRSSATVGSIQPSNCSANSGIAASITPATELEYAEGSNPIDKLYNMQNTYFSFT